MRKTYSLVCNTAINKDRIVQNLDRQLAFFKDRLLTEVGLTLFQAENVATLIANEIRALPAEAKEEIKAASPVPLSARLDELHGFQSWKDFVASCKKGHPGITRADVIVQNYVCFVYLKDACFEVVARCAPSDSVVARLAAFLSRGSIRDFRNAFSHANWSYNADFSGLKCWGPRKCP
jgi:hypothetical protein